MLAVSGMICCASDENRSSEFIDDAGVPEVRQPYFSAPAAGQQPVAQDRSDAYEQDPPAAEDAPGEPVPDVFIMPDARLHAWSTVPLAAEGVMLADQGRPPGTLGWTYRRKSHAIPSDKHPRTAMLAVRNSIGASVLSAQNMGGFRMKSGVWLFETSRPLDFGASHIVRVEARSTLQEVEPSSVRFVRLIPGRLVYLDF